MIKVSVLLPTYNQEKYIGKALESIVVQKTDFEYEIMVGDDASNDGTRKIVEEYRRKHPEIVKTIIRKKNLGAYRNFLDLIKRAQGDYIAFLEGDDYWIDEEKLQKQVDFLEKNPDYAAVFGRCKVVDEHDYRRVEMEKWFLAFQGGEYTALDYEKYLLPGQTATAMYRKETIINLIDKLKSDKRVMPRVPVIDRFLVLGVLSVGRIFTFEDFFAAYRYILDKNSGSWSSKNDYYSFKNVVFYLFGMKEMERVGKLLGVRLCFDNRRWYEFEKVADYKGKISFVTVNAIRFFTWLWYVDKEDFHRRFKERHGK